MNVYSTIIGFFIGTILGSFSKAMADRSLRRGSFWKRSYCESCKHKLSWYDLVPLFSYLQLFGRCRYCKKSIGEEYIILEIIYGIIFAFLFWQTSFKVPDALNYSPETILFFVEILLKSFFITILGIVTITDLKKMIIPDRVIIPATAGLFIALIVTSIYKIVSLFFLLRYDPIGKFLIPPHSDYFYRQTMLIGQTLGLSFLTGLAIALFFLFLIIITRGKGMGGGDVKLGFFFGLMLGFPNGLLALVLSFFTGAVVALGLIAAGKKSFGQTLPFGPFLVLGSLIALFWGKQIVDIYLNL